MTNQRTMKIFVSYRRQDSGHLAGRLYGQLADHFGHEGVFMDVDSLSPGTNFYRAISWAIDASDVVLALIGPSWVAARDDSGGRRLANPSDLVRIEILTALQQNIRLIPILVDGARMPDAGDLPAVLHRLTERHAISLKNASFQADVDALISAITRRHETRVDLVDPRHPAPKAANELVQRTANDSSASPPAASPPIPTSRPRSAPPSRAPSGPSLPRRRHLILIVALALVGVAVVTSLIWTAEPPSSSGNVPSSPSARGTSPAAAAIEERQLTGHTNTVNAVATAQLDGRLVVMSGSEDDTVRVWDLASEKPLGAPFTGHSFGVNAVATAQLDGRPVVVSSGGDATVRVWDLATGKPVGAPFTGHTAGVFAVTTAQLGGRPVVVSGSLDDTVRVWDMATGKPVGTPITHAGGVVAVAVAQLDGRPVVVSGGGEKILRAWDLATGKPVGSPLTGHTAWVDRVATALLDGRPVVISSGDGTVRVWDLGTGKPVGSPFTDAGGVIAVAAGQLGGRPVVASGGGDGTVRVWDLATGKAVGSPFTGHTSAVRAVATAQLNGRLVVISGGDDGTVRVWDLAA